MAPVMQIDLREYLPLVASGKVREIYELDQSTLLFVATDRISGMAHGSYGHSRLTQLYHIFSLRCGDEECTPIVHLALALRYGKMFEWHVDTS